MAKRRQSTEPFINGWAVPHTSGRILHAVLSPDDLGGKEAALCGIFPVQVWKELPDEEPYYSFKCTTCLNRFRVMYEEDDSRLTTEDRTAYRQIEAEFQRQLVKAD